MTNCQDYWCEHHGSVKCENCKSSENERERPELQVLLKRRADKLMGVNPSMTQEYGQER